MTDSQTEYHSVMYWRLNNEPVMYQHCMSMLDDLTPNMLVPEQFPLPQNKAVVKFLGYMLEKPDMEEYHSYIDGLGTSDEDTLLRREFFYLFMSMKAMRKILEDNHVEVSRMLETIDVRHDVEALTQLSDMVVGLSRLDEFPLKDKSEMVADLDTIANSSPVNVEAVYAKLAVQAATMFSTDEQLSRFFRNEHTSQALNHWLLRETADQSFLVVVGSQWT